MTSFSQIIGNNSRTFYNYRTNGSKSLRLHYSVIGCVSVILSAVFRFPSNDIYTGFVACQALLVGFSFNLTFYLSANGRLRIPNSDLIEDKIEVERLNILGREIFYNIGYFNLVSVFSVIASLALLIFSALKPFPCFALKNLCDIVSAQQNVVGLVVWHLVLFCAYFLAIESMATFLRMIRRTNAYFEDRALLLESAE